MPQNGGMEVVMKKGIFSKAVLKLLEENGIKEEDIFAASPVDMNTECEYADGFVVVTLEKLAIITSPPTEVRSFKGYMTKQTPRQKDEKQWALKLYDLEKVEALKTELQVACSVLVADIEGISYRLIAFSNLYKREMHKLIRTFDRLSAELKGGDRKEGGPGEGEEFKKDEEGGLTKEERLEKIKTYGKTNTVRYAV